MDVPKKIVDELSKLVNNEEYKMVICVRKDLKLPKGKLAVQVAHAAVSCAIKSMKYDKENFEEWFDSGQKKVAVWVENEEEIWQLKSKCEESGIISSIVFDAGRTVVKEGTLTCLGIGPGKESEIDKLTSELKLV